MKKNILIILLAIAAVFFYLYAFIKSDEAEKAAIEANQQRNRLDAIALEAERVKAEAKRQEALVTELQASLEACTAKNR